MANSKKRRFLDRSIAIPVEHPDGGTYYLLPVDLMQQASMNDELASLNHELTDDALALARAELQPLLNDGDQISSSTPEEELRVLAGRYGVRLSVKIDAEKKSPVEKTWQSQRAYVAAKIAIIRRYCLARVDDFVDADNRPIEMTPKMMEAAMAELSTRELDADVPLREWDPELKKLVPKCDPNGKPMSEHKKVPANELVFAWVNENALRLATSGQEEEKNSSSTPSTALATPAS